MFFCFCRLAGNGQYPIGSDLGNWVYMAVRFDAPRGRGTVGIFKNDLYIFLEEDFIGNKEK